MSFTQHIAAIGAFAVTLIALPLAALGTDAEARLAASGRIGASAAVPHSIPLERMEMGAVQGDGWLKKIIKFIWKVIRWPRCQMTVCNPYPDPFPPFVSTSEELSYVPSQIGDVTEYYEDTETVAEYFDDDAAYYEGRVAYTETSRSGPVLVGSSGGGGGGGDPCEMTCNAY